MNEEALIMLALVVFKWRSQLMYAGMIVFACYMAYHVFGYWQRSKKKKKKQTENDHRIHTSSSLSSFDDEYDNSSSHQMIQPDPRYHDLGTKDKRQSQLIQTVKEGRCMDNLVGSIVGFATSTYGMITCAAAIYVIYQDWCSHHHECYIEISDKLREHETMWTFCQRFDTPTEFKTSHTCLNAKTIMSTAGMTDHNATMCAIGKVFSHVYGWKEEGPGLTYFTISFIETWRSSWYWVLLICFVLSLAVLVYIWRVPMYYARRGFYHGSQMYEQHRATRTQQQNEKQQQQSPSYHHQYSNHLLMSEASTPIHYNAPSQYLLQPPPPPPPASSSFSSTNLYVPIDSSSPSSAARTSLSLRPTSQNSFLTALPQTRFVHS